MTLHALNLKVGDLFRFTVAGPLFIRCTGGYRAITGGPVQKLDGLRNVLMLIDE